jgi:uncharacterized protein YndB with AHSA1/START domain
MDDPTVVESVTVGTAVGDVWRALVDADVRSRWWEGLDLDPAPGGRVEERWTDATGRTMRARGVVTAVDAPRLLRFTWADDGWPTSTEVGIRLAPAAGGTRVQVRETGLERLPDAVGLVGEHRAGWRAHLARLRRHLETPPA